MKKIILYIIGIVVGGMITLLLLTYYNNNQYLYFLDAAQIEEESFRSMDFTKDGLLHMRQFANCYDLDVYDVITTWMISDSYHWKKREINTNTLDWYESQKKQMLFYDENAFLKIRGTYEKILTGLNCFPIPRSSDSSISFVTYENSWGDERTYGGERSHEGTDIMGMDYERGFYPVISITDGVIEQMGWLEQGGWRIGIRTKKGAYLYYAHLYSYFEGLEIGSQIKAGDILGYMGDSGYGKEEGTIGMFPVHLHLGMYIETIHYEEMSINPYHILRYLDNFVRVYNY